MAFALFLLTLLLFARTAGNDFVNYDDPDYVTKNPHVQQGLGVKGLQWALTSGEASNWHPLTWVSHMADWSLFGANASGHHTVSVLWHALNAVLAFIVLRRLTGDYWPSAFCAALFAWHPLRVESVAWVAERKDLLSGFFGLLAIWAYAGYARALSRDRAMAWRYYTISLLYFALGLMCKPMLVTLPCVLLLLDFWPLGRGFVPALGLKGGGTNSGGGSARRAPADGGAGGAAAVGVLRIGLEKIPYFALSIASSVVTFLVQRSGGAVSSTLQLSARLSNALVSVPRYLEKLVVPFNLAVLYPHPGHWAPGLVASAALLIVAVTFAAWRQRKGRPWLIVGWLWFLGMLIPVSGIVQVGIQSMADRYTYLPMIGIEIAVIWSVKEWATSSRLRTRFTVAAIAVLALAAVRTWDQIGLWKNSFTLFDHAIAVTDANFMAYNNRGVFLEDQGRAQEALADYRRSLEINPGFDDANANLGHLLDRQGKPQEALPYLRRALEINPNLLPARTNLGTALSDAGQVDEAIVEYRRVLSRDPDNEDALNNYGVALAMKGDTAAAEERLRAAIRLKPSDSDAHSNLGNVHSMMGRLDDAIADYRIAISLNPQIAGTHLNLSQALRKGGREAEASAEYAQALKLQAQAAGK